MFEICRVSNDIANVSARERATRVIKDDDTPSVVLAMDDFIFFTAVAHEKLTSELTDDEFCKYKSEFMCELNNELIKYREHTMKNK